MSGAIPPFPPGPVPSGTDVRDLRPWLNRMQEAVTSLVNAARMAAIQPRQWSPSAHLPQGPSGRVYVLGNLATITGTKADWIEIDVYADPPTAVYTASPVYPPGPGKVYRRAAGVQGDIYIDRLG